MELLFAMLPSLSLPFMLLLLLPLIIWLPFVPLIGLLLITKLCFIATFKATGLLHPLLCLLGLR